MQGNATKPDKQNSNSVCVTLRGWIKNTATHLYCIKACYTNRKLLHRWHSAVTQIKSCLIRYVYDIKRSLFIIFSMLYASDFSYTMYMYIQYASKKSCQYRLPFDRSVQTAFYQNGTVTSENGTVIEVTVQSTK